LAKVKVGIPRALLYYHYFPLWKGFFEALGAEVVVSSRTTKGILNKGISRTVDDACLPIKLYLGHVENLRDKVDYLFVPRLVSVERNEFTCPKFLGLPDMVRHNFKNLPQLINVDIDLNKKNRNLIKGIIEVGKIFTDNPLKIFLAYNKGLKEWKIFKNYLTRGMTPVEAIKAIQKGEMAIDRVKPARLTIGLIGHAYNLYDDHINMNVIQKLRKMGVKVVTPENVPEEIINQQVKTLPKKLFWTMGKHLLGSTFYFLQKPSISGIIHVTAFGCGIDSMMGELMERKTRKERDIPYMVLTLDEHTGEAGVVTRLEAFIDMIKWKEVKPSESDLSTHGQHVHTH
jgi:predicted nucleotide-binding protein (sugar kinase/HSP70/actin superfamily)